MRRVCAWCKGGMGERPGAAGETHGICIPCLAVHFPGMEAAAAGLFEEHDVVERAEIHGIDGIGEALA